MANSPISFFSPLLTSLLPLSHCHYIFKMLNQIPLLRLEKNVAEKAVIHSRTFLVASKAIVK